MAGERAQAVFDIAAGAAVRSAEALRSITDAYSVVEDPFRLNLDDVQRLLEAGDRAAIAEALPSVMQTLMGPPDA